MAAAQTFLGRGWSFPPEFSKEHDLPSPPCAVMAQGVADIEQSVRLILATAPGERTMEPLFGCPLGDFLFRPVDASLRTMIRDAIDNALLRYEPRIVVNSVGVDAAQAVNGRLEITLDYTVSATNTRHNLVYPYCRIEGTSLRLPG